MGDLKTKVIEAINNLLSKEVICQDDTNRLSVLSVLLSLTIDNK